MIIKELERSKVEQLALEFAGPQLDPAVLRHCPSKTVLFGSVFNGGNTVEEPEQIAARLRDAARYLPPEQLQVAPDCGLVVLPPDIARAKLVAMVQGARLARQRL